MALSEHSGVSKKSRYPLPKIFLSHKHLEPRQIIRSRNSLSRSNIHPTGFSVSRLSNLINSFFKYRSTSRSTAKQGLHFVKGAALEEPTDMDLGPTVFDRFYPLLYDGIRPAKITSSYGLKHNQPTSRPRFLQEIVIPIHFEGRANNSVSEKASAKKNSDRGTHVSPIVVDDVSMDLVEPTACKQDSSSESSKILPSKACESLQISSFKKRDVINSVKENKQLNVDTIDLSETPYLENDILQPRGQKTIVNSKSSWTEIPIYHVKNKDFSILNSPYPCEKNVSKVELGCSKQNKNNVDNTSLCSMPSNKTMISFDQNSVPPVLARCDLHSKLEQQDISALNDFRSVSSRLHNASYSISGEDLLTEQKVHPTPSYPIYEQLKIQLSKENRVIDYIRGDGNCFFRTLSKELYRTEKYHKALRSLIVDLIATNRSCFTQFIDGGDVQAHVEKMGEENTWATTCEIYAAATLFQRDIYMLTPDQSNLHYKWLLFKPLFKLPLNSDCGLTSLPQNKKLEDPCYLTVCNTNGNHYDRVVPDHGGCNCFLPAPHLEGQSGSVVID